MNGMTTIAIAKYPQYPWPYLMMFVKPTKEIVIDRMMINAEIAMRRLTGFSILLKILEFSKRETNANVVVTPVDVKQRINVMP